MRVSKKFNSNVIARKDHEATFFTACPDFRGAERVISLFSELKKKILQSFDYGYRKDPELQKRISFIRQGSGHADTIQDLNDLAVLGQAYPVPLKKIKFDMALLDKSAETANDMASLLAIVNGEKMQDNEKKIIRDKAFTFLKEAYDEVRACGKYVFADNPDRLKGYLNQYFKSKRKKKGDTNDENIENVAE